jgi:hypothetical protein
MFLLDLADKLMELKLQQAIEIPLTILKNRPISEGLEDQLMILMFHKEIISPASLFVLERELMP